MTPARKLEAALVADVLVTSVIPELSGLSIYPGLNYETKGLPRLQCAVPDVSPAPGFDGIPDAREYVADVYLGFLASAELADGAARTTYDGRIEAVQALFEGRRSDTDLQTLLNYQGEPDGRTVPQLYLYQCRFMGQSQDHLDKGVWQILLHYQFEFTVHDGQAAE